MSNKLHHNRPITIGDQSIFNLHESSQPKNPHLKRFEKMHKSKIKKKIKASYQQYGSIEEIRKARMETNMKKGWTKASPA
jgi:hypothetical protein